MQIRYEKLWTDTCTICSCIDNRRLNEALELAGSNRGELEKVLTHYKDSGEKYNAACFLIETMPKYYSYKGNELDSARVALNTAGKDGAVAPELVKRWKYPQGLEKIYDAHIVTADFLIKNIDHAFAVWEKRPWNKCLSFEDFCELILPYRLGNEPLEEWRQEYENHYAFLLDSVYCGTDVIEAAATVGRYLKQEAFVYNWDFNLPHPGASYLMEHRIGTCLDACDLTLYVMRSLGIPAAIDFYSYSSETRKGHTWNVIRDTTGIYWGMWFTDRELERGKVYSDKRKAGKVFRKCFGRPYRRNVSANYFSDTLRLNLKDKNMENISLGVFHPHYWVAIDEASVMDGMATFPNVESEVVYAPLLKKGGEYRTVDYPFLFDGKKTHSYIPDLSKRDTVALWRKHTFFAWIRNRLGKLSHARIDFSDRKDFQRVGYSYFVPDTPRICHTEVRLPSLLKCRYIRYLAEKGRPTEIAEFQFYGKEKQYYPLLVQGGEQCSIVTPMEDAFDNDPLTYYATKISGATFFVDLGESVEIERFVIMPRNDDNFIRVGDMYELFYHGGKEGWISLGRQLATEPKLFYENMPRGALFHLRCLTRGEEEQVFHIENGKQKFISNQGVDL